MKPEPLKNKGQEEGNITFHWFDIQQAIDWLKDKICRDHNFPKDSPLYKTNEWIEMYIDIAFADIIVLRLTQYSSSSM